MADRMAVGNDEIPKKSPSSPSVKKDDVDANSGRLAKEFNEKSVRYQEQVYWLKLELDSTRQEKQAVEARMTHLYSALQQLKEGAAANDDMEVLMQKHERTVRTLNEQIALLRASSDQVVNSLKDEVRELMNDKAKSEMELMNHAADLESDKQAMEKRLAQKEEDGGDDQLVKEIHRLRQEKAALAETLRKERAASRHTISTLRQDKTGLTEQVEKMQGDLLVLRASVETVNSIDQMMQDRDESLKALERVSTLWDRADSTLNQFEALTDTLESAGDSDDKEQLLSALESAALLHGQVKVALMLIEMKLRNTLACLKNDASQLAVAITDAGVAEQIKTAQSESLAETRKVADMVQKQLTQLESRASKETAEVQKALQDKMGEIKELQERQAKLEKDIFQMSMEELTTMARDHAADENSQVELFVSRKILERLQKEVMDVVRRLKDKNETVGRLEATIEEYTARERALIAELKRFMSEHSSQTLKDGENSSLAKLLAESDIVEEEIVEEEILDDDVIEEEIIEDTVPDFGSAHNKTPSSLGIMIEEEEEIVEE